MHLLEAELESIRPEAVSFYAAHPTSILDQREIEKRINGVSFRLLVQKLLSANKSIQLKLALANDNFLLDCIRNEFIDFTKEKVLEQMNCRTNLFAPVTFSQVMLFLFPQTHSVRLTVVF